MENGTLSHERIQGAIEASGIMLSKEKKMTNDDPPILGYHDVEINVDGKSIPIEIKTCSDVAFEYRKSSGKAPGYHIGQLLIYMYIDNHDLGLLLYENKNTHELLGIPVEMTPGHELWVENTFDWCREVKSASDADKLPKKQTRANAKICKSCPMKELCFNSSPDGEDIKLLGQLA